jgi:hypothetical protein
MFHVFYRVNKSLCVLSSQFRYEGISTKRNCQEPKKSAQKTPLQPSLIPGSETHLSREIDRTLKRFERAQRMPKCQALPLQADVEIS